MSTLTIQPVVYEGKRLSEVGERLVEIFYPRIKNYKINDGLGLETLLTLEKEASFPVLRRTNVFDGYDLAVYNEFTQLFRDNQRPLLIITQLPHEDGLYGCAPYFDLPFVSVYRSEVGEIDTNRHVKMVTILDAHELGHAFKLDGHSKEFKGQIHNIKELCIMEHGHSREAYNRTITWYDYLDAYSSKFCDDCYKDLGIQKPKLTIAVVK